MYQRTRQSKPHPTLSVLVLLALVWTQFAIAAHQFEHDHDHDHGHSEQGDGCAICLMLDRADDAPIELHIQSAPQETALLATPFRITPTHVRPAYSYHSRAPPLAL